MSVRGMPVAQRAALYLVCAACLLRMHGRSAPLDLVADRLHRWADRVWR